MHACRYEERIAIKTRRISSILDEWPALQFGEYILPEFSAAIGVKEKQKCSLYRKASKMMDAMKLFMKKTAKVYIYTYIFFDLFD